MRTSPVAGDSRIGRLSKVPSEGIHEDHEGQQSFGLED
jgi:hypothetical protein